MAFFDASYLPKAKKEYVCFIDILGMQSKMIHSLNQSANYMFKLHSTILESYRLSGYKSISIYPIMDGAYITSTKKNDILNLLTRVYQALCKSLNDTDFKFWYLVRSSLAYGEIIHGRDIPYNASLEFSSRVGYKEHLLIGAPIIEAYIGERNAAPMGIYINKSVLSVKPYNIPLEWKWFNNSNIKCNENDMNNLKIKLKEYYVWLRSHGAEQGYLKEKQDDHYSKATEYFSI